MADIFCRPLKHEYDMAIYLIIVITMSFTIVALGPSVVSFLAAVCCFSFCFLRLYIVRAAIDIDRCCAYNRSQTVKHTNLRLRIYVS